METIKLLIVFVIIMILLWNKKPLAPVMIGASTVLAVLYGTGITGFLQIIWNATKGPDTVELVGILIMVMILERILREQGYLERMLNALAGLFKDRRIVMGLIPAFIGLMPSAGGAMFSAPLVEQAVGKTVSAEDKAFINFYYRHIWEYLLPIYPGVLLVASITGIPLAKMLLGLLPFGILIIVLGLPFLFSIKVNDEDTAQDTPEQTGRRQLINDVLFSTLPVIVVVALVLASVNVALAAIIVVGFLAVRHHYTPGKFFSLVRRALVMKTLVIIWAVMLFKEVMTATGSIDGLPFLLGKLPIPEIAVAGLIAFMIAYLTGQTGFYVGIAFPVVVAAMGGQVNLSQAVFVFMAGSAGTMLSPMHLCLSLSIDYFKADFNKVLRKLIIPESIIVITAFVTYMVRTGMIAF